MDKTFSKMVNERSLRGTEVVLDPGYQLGNAQHLRQINRKVDARYGLRKACKKTGISAHSGYPEATFHWNVVQQVRKLLQAQGVNMPNDE